MIDRVIEWSAKYRGLVILVALAAAAAGWWSLRRVPLDALPDLSDTQVIVYSRWDRSPDLIEDQVTYPIVTALARRAARQGGARHLRLRLLVRLRRSSRTAPTSTGRARARSSTSRRCCRACRRASTTELGPDATGLGWVFQYVLVDDVGHAQPGRPAVAAGLVPPLSPEVGARRRRRRVARRLRPAVPGQRRSAPPARLRPADRPRRGRRAQRQQRGRRPRDRVRRRRIHGARPRLRASRVADLENIVLAVGESGTPVRIKDVGQVALGPDMRRGAADLDGTRRSRVRASSSCGTARTRST